MTKKELSPAQIIGEAPLGDSILPVIDSSQPINQLCRSVATNLERNTLFNFNGEFITIEKQEIIDQDGSRSSRPRTVPMTPDRFVSWVGDFMYFRRADRPNESYTSLTVDQARKILASDVLRAAMPEIKEICPVRLPLWRRAEDGTQSVELAPEGYDESSKIYTCSCITFDESTHYEPEAIKKAMFNLLGEFPWVDYDTDEDDDNLDPAHIAKKHRELFDASRSVACYMAFTLGQFCRHLITRHPAVIVNANIPGSGKTLLASLGLAAVFGTPEVNPMPKKEDDLGKLLFTHLLYGNPYILLDDITGMASTFINQYATTRWISDRVLGSNTLRTVENRMQIIGTGNDVRLTPDVARRALIIDLFLDVKPTEKKHKRTLSSTNLDAPEWRRSMLQILWSLVCNWAAKGCPRALAPNSMPSFESFVDVAGNIVVAAGWISPFTARPDEGMGGDKTGRGIEMIIQHMASLVTPQTDDAPHKGLARPYTQDDALEIAKLLGITDDVTFGIDKQKSLGHKLAAKKGMRFIDEYGRRCKFSRRRESDRTKYYLYIRSEPAADTAIPRVLSDNTVYMDPPSGRK